ncbi:hypothetical protein SAMD00019534_037360 [Acytostelium subglobosum LB1]|uniref:hypothetical protein n=1 Tax=Acytostelium subglobosum LB1 TaxID=1410327 RepID=UPI000644AA73|nr:hypothetical protein SAMD00019534_037360 [Acytostelium subglobosum LB1]GAM20561.1 hypothetical protein SAMD00019534_037360 [Acytostelium subglobosum LB1]|eukprot:XP_012760082.1 hypothetical protein SAMD00019534_037360 [Acytostelium subglobosum LB1]
MTARSTTTAAATTQHVTLQLQLQRSISLVFVLLLLVLSFGTHDGVQARIISNTTTLVDFTLLNGESLVLQNANITLVGITPNISAGSILTVSGNCFISSATQLRMTFDSLIGQTGILTLNNNDLLINMNGGGLQINDKFELTYSGSVASETIILSGGKVNIGSTAELTITGGPAVGTGVLAITSAISNGNKFNSQPAMRIVPSLVQSAAASGASIFIFSELHATKDFDTLSLSRTQLFAKEINLRNGNLYMDNAAWLTYSPIGAAINYKGEMVKVWNTTVVLKANMTIGNTKMTTTIPLGIINFKTGSTLQLASATTLLLDFLINGPNYQKAVSIQSTMIFSQDNGVNCGGAINSYTADERNTTARINLQTPDFPSAVLGATWVCSPQGMSIRIYSVFNSDNLVVPPCNVTGQIRCYGSDVCIDINTSSCYTTCAKNSASPIRANAARVTSPLRANSDSLLLASVSATTNFTCWDGQCIQNSSDCMPYPACPLDLPRRCAGTCVRLDQECPQCNATHPITCEAGCSNVTTCNPYNGCRLYQIQCPQSTACVDKIEDCAKYGNHSLPLSVKPIMASSDLYSTLNNYVPLWSRSDNTNTISMSTHIIIANDSIDPNQTTATARPIADSLAIKVNGAGINSNFDYFQHVLTAPFNINVDGRDKSEFDNGRTASFIFSNITSPDGTPIDPSNMCLAFINAAHEWECTPYPLVRLANGALSAQTSHFTSFAVLLKSSDEDDSAASKKRMAIIVSTVIGGIVLLTITIALLINFKLRNVSLRRWFVHRSDPNMSAHTKLRRSFNNFVSHSEQSTTSTTSSA